MSPSKSATSANFIKNAHEVSWWWIVMIVFLYVLVKLVLSSALGFYMHLYNAFR